MTHNFMEINNIIDTPKQKLNDKTALSGLGALSHSQKRERDKKLKHTKRSKLINT